MSNFNTNYKENFLSAVINYDLLEEAVAWIQSKLSPDDVFDKDQLEEWAENNGYIKE